MAAIALPREIGFTSTVLIVMKNSFSALLKMHDVTAVVYMLKLKS